MSKVNMTEYIENKKGRVVVGRERDITVEEHNRRVYERERERQQQDREKMIEMRKRIEQILKESGYDLQALIVKNKRTGAISKIG